MKSKILFSALVILFIFLLAGVAAAAPSTEIKTTDDFMAIDDSLSNLGKSYILMNDLDFTGIEFEPIGTSSGPFKGIFNGNGYIISNITFNNSSTGEIDDVGLFGYADGAEISNVVLKDVNIRGKNHVGSLLGRGSAVTIRSCSVDISAGNNFNITGNYAVGGLVGCLDSSSSLSTSYATVNVNAVTSCAGGLVGFMGFLSSISNSYSMGDATALQDVGGFVGHMTFSSIVSDSYATGDAEGNLRVGGFSGFQAGKAFNCFYNGTPYSNNDIQGFFVTSSALKYISTFEDIEDADGILSSWNISSSPNPNSVWYINEGKSSPLLYWAGNHITFDADGGSPAPSSQFVNNGGRVTKPADPFKTGAAFSGWTLNGSNYNFNAPVTSDILLVAVYDFDTCTVTFNSDDGTLLSSETVVYGGLATKPADPDKAGHTFSGWKLGNAAYNFNTPVTSDLELVAVYDVAVYTVTFDSAGGTVILPESVIHDGFATKPADPDNPGFTFVRWNLGTDEYDFNTPVTSDLTLVAEYTKIPAPSGGGNRNGVGKATIVDTSVPPASAPEENIPTEDDPSTEDNPSNNPADPPTSSTITPPNSSSPISTIWLVVGSILFIAIGGAAYILFFRPKNKF